MNRILFSLGLMLAVALSLRAHMSLFHRPGFAPSPLGPAATFPLGGYNLFLG